jgi:serine/threonine-protein kinase
VSVWWLAIVPIAVIAAVMGTLRVKPDAGIAPPVVRFVFSNTPTGVFNRVLAVSPDGRFVAGTTSTSRSQSLVVRSLDRLDPRFLDGTAGARDPAVSPDSRQIAFWATDQIKRVPVDGGPVVSVGSAPGRPLGLSWAADGHIYFGRGAEGVWRIPAAGGSAERVKPVRPGQYAHGPQLLPGGEWLIFTRAARVNGWNDAEIVAARLGTDEERVVVRPGHDARWVTGYLTFVHDSQLYAIAFDARTRSTSGEPVLVADGLILSTMDTTGAAFYAVSDSGVLAYIGGPGADAQQMVWKEGGRDVPLPIPPGRISQVRVSPDGRRIAARVYDNGWHIWLYDVDRPTGTKVTSEGSNRTPVWSSDGAWIYYASDAKGGLDVWRRRADLAGPPELVYGPDGNQIPVGVTPEASLVFLTLDRGGSTIGQVDLSRPSVVKSLVDRPNDAPEAALTRDGRLLVYQVSTGADWQIRILELSSGRQWTAATGFNPAWSPDGMTLMYQHVGSVRLLPLSVAQGVTSGGPVILEGPGAVPGCCDLVSRSRVLALKPLTADVITNVVVNWPSLVSKPR